MADKVAAAKRGQDERDDDAPQELVGETVVEKPFPVKVNVDQMSQDGKYRHAGARHQYVGPKHPMEHHGDRVAQAAAQQVDGQEPFGPDSRLYNGTNRKERDGVAQNMWDREMAEQRRKQAIPLVSIYHRPLEDAKLIDRPNPGNGQQIDDHIDRD